MDIEKEINECFITPVPWKLIVRQDDYVEPSKLIVTPDNAKRRPTTGMVIRVGADITAVKPGQRVVYPHFSGTALDFRARPSYRVLGQDELLGIIDLPDVYLDENAA